MSDLIERKHVNRIRHGHGEMIFDLKQRYQTELPCNVNRNFMDYCGIAQIILKIDIGEV